MRLVGLAHFLRAALRYDVQRRLGRDPANIAEVEGWNYLWDMVSEILRDPSSHTISALHGDKYVPGSAERAVWSVFETWVNTQKKGASIKVKRPWAGTAPTFRAQKPKDPHSEERRNKLRAIRP